MHAGSDRAASVDECWDLLRYKVHVFELDCRNQTIKMARGKPSKLVDGDGRGFGDSPLISQGSRSILKDTKKDRGPGPLW